MATKPGAKDPEVGDIVRVRLPDGTTKRVKLTAVAIGGWHGVPEGQTNGRVITRWMIENADK
jgi:hypothetical protein